MPCIIDRTPIDYEKNREAIRAHFAGDASAVNTQAPSSKTPTTAPLPENGLSEAIADVKREIASRMRG